MVETGALLVSTLIELGVLALHVILPAQEIDGYVRDTKGKPLRYRLNGIPVIAASVLAWVALCWTGLLPWGFLYEHSGTTCVCALIVGLAFSAWIVAQGPRQSPSILTDFFLGTIENPRTVVAGRILDAKLYLYLVGAVHLELNLLSYAAAHFASPDPNPGVALAAALLSWFVAEYLWWENVHLYTYDFFAERVGVKLGFGCLCFYPFFYPIGLLAGARLPNPHHAPAYHLFAAAVYFSGWALSRGPNLQKFWFKRRVAPPAALAPLGLSPVKTVRSADGKHELLCGGFWGVSRHVNYLGETLEAVGIVLALGHPGDALLPWLYPLYYVLLFITRERDDDKRCREKYGALWDEYCRQVPYRIIPYVY
ncbi:hypothetical protein Daus18300_007006 [Diaporthe australafricana]|uniref:Delta(14)-sterol reductase n=1 Tax=Diaporthe australafricana TaxID=127596 RepID=A0ABR3WQQ9_9PEZI